MKQNIIILSITSVCLILLSYLVLPIRHGFMIGGGDFYQYLNLPENVTRFFYAWTQQHGQGQYNTLSVTFVYYAFLSLISALSGQIVIPPQLYLGLFMTAAFMSFFFSVSVFFPKLDMTKRVLVGLLYAMNNFVIGIFSYTWGYTHHFWLYIFFPVLNAGLYHFLSNKLSLKNTFALLVILIVSLPSFNNPAFLMLLLFFQGLMFIGLLLSGLVSLNKQLFTKIGVLAVLYTVVFLPIILPFISSFFGTVEQLQNTQALGGTDYLVSWLQTTSSHFLSSFALSMGKYRYPFVNSPFGLVYIITSLSYFAGLILLLQKNHQSLLKKQANTQLILLLSSLYLAFTFLSLRSIEPFTWLLEKFYLFPAFIFFRSEDKIFLVLPFLYSLVIAGLLQQVTLNFARYKILWIAAAIIGLLPFAMIQQNLKLDYNRFDKKTTPEYTYITQIPENYFELKKIINKDQQTTAILSVPYSVKNSLNWSNYPSWHYVGHDPLYLLYNKRYISANSYDNPNMETALSIKNFTVDQQPSTELLSILQKFGTEYILWHKDVDAYWLEEAQHLHSSLIQLADQKILKLVMDTTEFQLFQLEQQLIRPVISLQSGNSVMFQQINPSLYRATLTLKDNDQLELLQSFDAGWTLYVVKPTSNECQEEYSYPAFNTTECIDKTPFFSAKSLPSFSRVYIPDTQHSLVADFNNSWTLDGTRISNVIPTEYYQKNIDGSITFSVELYYQYQDYIYYMYVVSGFGLAVAAYYFIRHKRAR